MTQALKKHLPVVLVVEDEPFVRIMGASALAEAGYGVIEACNADEALRVLEDRPDVRVVFTDVDMPGSLDGLALARRVHDGWPQIGVVVTSGRYLVDAERMPHGDSFVAKPYAVQALVRRIEEAMRRGWIEGDEA